MVDEQTKRFINELNEESRQWPVKYFPTINQSVFYPVDLFTDIKTISSLANAIELSTSRQREVSLEGNIIGNNYTISKPVVGEEDMVLTERTLSPTEENPYHPYQAIVFGFHTHPKNLTPSQSDLCGYLFAAGSMQRAIWHKKSRVNPVFIIGRSIEGKKELLCYQFLREELPTPDNSREQDDFIQEYYKKLNPILHPAQHMGDETAAKKRLKDYVTLMNSCDGIIAFGKTL